MTNRHLQVSITRAASGVNATMLRLAARLLHTGRYLTDLLLWSRIMVVKRTARDAHLSAHMLSKKAVNYDPPQLLVKAQQHSSHLQHGFNIVYTILFANLRQPSHRVPVRHALPGPAFAGVYLWDSAFIALIWRHWDREVALDVIEGVVRLRDGDRLQHVVADFVRSPFTQPPLIAWALAKLSEEQALPSARLHELYRALTAYHQWLNRNRRLANGLYFWQHPYESGVENAPRFSSRDEKKLADTTQLAAPDLSTYMIMQCEALAKLAQRLGQSEEAHLHAAAAETIKCAMNATLWDERDGLYYDTYLPNGDKVRSRTIASLLPLAAGVASPHQAERMLSHIRDQNGFGSPIPLPSVALNDPAFEKDMWRGPVWLNTAYLVLQGLLRYGWQKEYGELAWQLCEGVFRVLESEHQVYEFYDPEDFHTRDLNRKKGNWWKAFTLGTGPQKDFVGWSGLVNTLMIEGLIGYSRSARQVTISPRLPSRAGDIQFSLILPQDGIRVDLSVEQGPIYRGQVVSRMETRSFALAPGEELTVEIR